MIDVQNIVRFGEKTVLDGISNTFEQGELIGLVAQNGTGKTTLMVEVL